MLDTGLAGCSALLTGGASGIGQSIAVALGSEGVHVRILDRCPAERTIALVRETGGDASASAVDLRNEAQVEAAIASAVRDLGQLDLFVNVAAVFATEPVTGITRARWDEALETNVTACAIVARGVARQMIEQGSGSILIVGSTVTCAPSYEGAAYRASKAALKSLMETLAIELAPFKIRVNMLTPGPFPTGLVADLPADQRAAAAREVPLGAREGDLAEVQAGACFLLSDRLASFITGAELFVDGGLHLRPLYIGPPDIVRELNA